MGDTEGSSATCASLLIKTSTGGKHNITAELSLTIGDLKEKIATVASVPAAEQKLIFSGRILKNDQTLTQCGIKTNTSLHLVKTRKTSAPTPAGSAQTASTASPATGIPASQAHATGATAGNPFQSLLGGSLGGGAGGQRMPSPEEMQRMMDNPMVQNMLDSPEVMEAMLMANPQMRQLMEQNPEVGRAMRDPQILRQAMEMQRNPNLMRESMRQHDRAMQNVESLPGGFNHLRQMYSNVQEPLERAADSMRQPPLSQPSGDAAGSGAAAPNPFASLFGNASASQGGTGAADAGGNAADSAHSGGGATGGGLFSNPVILESMRSAMANPEVLQQMASMNPYMNTEALRQPGNLEAMIKMQQAMQQLESAGIMSHLHDLHGSNGQGTMQSMMGGLLNNPAATQAMMQPDTMQAVMQLQQSMTTLQQAGLMPTAAHQQQGLGGFGADLGAPQQTPQATQGYSERYASEIATVQAMGFTDEAAIIQALIVCEGNVEQTINFLLGA